MTERRERRRYPVKLQARLRAIGRKDLEPCSGEVLNMSSAAILFRSNDPIPFAETVEIAIEWPVLLYGRVLMQLVVRGPIARRGHKSLVIEFWTHEFRTRSTGQIGLHHPVADKPVTQTEVRL